MMRSLTALLLVAFAAAAEPVAAQMEGSYNLVEINGQGVPAPSPSEEGLVMSKMTLLLTPEGRFVMVIRAGAEGQLQEFEQEIEGTYTVADDTLALTAENLEEARTVEFRFTLADDTLQLYDQHGDEYTLRRS